MYECGMRLGRESSGLTGLQRQAKAYLAALNSLRLVNEKNAWIVKPLSSQFQVLNFFEPVQSINFCLLNRMRILMEMKVSNRKEYHHLVNSHFDVICRNIFILFLS
jgi:hypothetical protein